MVRLGVRDLRRVSRRSVRCRPLSSLLGTLAIFAVGLFFRPFGGLLIAGFTDRFGRRGGLVLSVLLMAAGSLVIAVCPTHAQICAAAPVLLLLARILQGLSGGEFAASASTHCQRRRPEHPTPRVFREHLGAVAQVVGFTVGGTVAYSTFAVYLPSYAQQAKGCLPPPRSGRPSPRSWC